MTKKITIIEADKPISGYWSELIQYRDLLYLLAWRDFKVRYKQTAVGVTWAFIKPLFTMIILTIVFGKVAKLPTEGSAPYSIMVFAAMLPWYFFSTALQDCSMSLVTKSPMVTKLYFPRILIPISPIFVNTIDFIIASSICALLMIGYQYLPNSNLVFIPLFFLLLCLIITSMSLWLSALNVKYRDFRFIVPFGLQLGLFISPVGFSSSIIPEQWRLLYSLNPLVGVIDGFRWCLLTDAPPLYLPALAFSLLWPLILLPSGYRFFKKSEREFADII
jgi:lipopolysaccharide transport system permease protein